MNMSIHQSINQTNYMLFVMVEPDGSTVLIAILRETILCAVRRGSLELSFTALTII
jgi:hypothetical protein